MEERNVQLIPVFRRSQTRMQILHPSAGSLYTGLTNAVSTIYRIEGWRTLWKGVSSVIVGAGKRPEGGQRNRRDVTGY